MRSHHAVALLLGIAAFSQAATAQVVIRERVEVDPAQPDSTAGPVNAPAPVAYAWPGGVRGRGTIRFYVTNAILRVHPISSLAATLTTSQGQSHSLPLSSVAQQTGESTVCLPSVDPNWTECDQWTYYGGLLVEFEVAADEDLDSLFVTGPGLSAAEKVGISEIVMNNDLDYLQLNCGYTYFAWGPYHPGDCNCMIGRTGEVHGHISVRWEFEADPAEQLLVTATPDTLAFNPLTLESSTLTVQAAYSDGTLAPLANSTQITYTASSTAYGSLAKISCNVSGCATVERGAALTLSYRPSASYLIKYLADGNHGDGSPPATAGPVCDTPVSVTVTGGGLSGEATVVIRGSSTSTELDTLAVTASPGILGPNEQAALSAVAVTAGGCEGGGLPANTPMTFSVEDDYYGELAYGMQQGTTIGGVPYSDAEAGVVLYDRNGRKPYYDWPVEVAVSGGGLTGTGEVLVDGSYEIQPCSTGNAMLDDERVQDGLMRLWAAATLGERGRRVSVDARLEFCGYIFPVFDGGFTMLAYDDREDYSEQTQVSASCPTPSNLPTDAVMVHTHPFYFGDPTRRGVYRVLEPSLPYDFDALDERNLQQGLVFDGHRMRFFYPGGSMDVPIDRCGY